MTLRSPVAAIVWEAWRVTRAEAAWKLALGTVGPLVVLALSAALAPAGNPEARGSIMDAAAAVAMILLVLPHSVSWVSLGRLNGGQPGFPLSLHFTRPVRTVFMVGLPMLYLTAASWAIYLVSALILRAISGYAFPLLPVAAWIAALTLVFMAGTWSTREKTVPLVVWLLAITRAFGVVMNRLTAVEIPGSYDWPPRLWPTLFDFPVTDYAWIALLGVASLVVSVAGVTRQRSGARWLEAPVTQRVGFWDRLVGLWRVPCPTSSPTRAQVWFDLKSSGLPTLTVGLAFAIVILLVSAVSGPIDAAINADPDVTCPIDECFYARAWPPLLTPFSMVIMLLLGGNAFGLRRKQGRTFVSAFEATQAHGVAQLAAIKLLVKSACVLAAIFAIAVSAWLSLPLLGDPVFVQMWGVPLSSQASGVNRAAAALTGYEQAALMVVAAVGVVTWVAVMAVLGALWTRYSRRANLTALTLLLSALALGILALAAKNRLVPPSVFDALFTAVRWCVVGGLLLTIACVSWSSVADRVLTMRYASGAAAISAAFAASWLTVLHLAGVQLGGMSITNAISVVSPALLPLMASVLAPWSLNRVRHV